MDNFWKTAITHYFLISTAVIFEDGAAAILSFVTFYLVPSFSNIELMPGLKTTFKSQIQVLKTMNYLNQQGYYK